ncbi:MAG: hypothetical protein HN353_12500 [Bdellovibrionales bacterium]|jgi:glutamyl-tRNA reductase|nr:hypothetical protein [Bdellovibrionales bacterium]MBT3526336.1 hypothetical protein [Bdellovibrionales bacterium]MBT7669075.1 hypothetical protein [Bdellovibrionales bacterium]MBT7765730.1 hypothetical protein [Bdellovibrionales bacterium]
MFNKLTLINLPPNSEITVPALGEVFVLETCQRTIILGYNDLPHKFVGTNCDQAEVFNGSTAYNFLLAIICGLKSKVVGESEIVNQFKVGLKRYMGSKLCSPYICNVLEKLLKDSKRVRTDHLLEVGQNSYSGIAKKLIEKQYRDGTVLILGSGALALSLIKILKKNHQLSISARNDKKVRQLCTQFNIESVSWQEKNKYEEFNVIINTIGTEAVLLDQQFFSKWQVQHKGLGFFVDLGLPSSISTPLDSSQGIYRLADILDLGVMLDSEKTKRVELAFDKIDQLTKSRMMNFTFNVPFGWGELNFTQP